MGGVLTFDECVSSFREVFPKKVLILIRSASVLNLMSIVDEFNTSAGRVPDI